MASKWYIVHVNTGFEERVKTQILDGANRKANEHLVIEEVLVPTESIVETQKGGKKKTSVRKFFPGYMLVKLELNEESWHFLRSIPKVISFVGGRPKDGVFDPNSVPDVSEDEVMRIKTQIQEGTLKPKPKVAFEKGETIKVIEGPFANFSGTIEEINAEKAF